MSSQIVAVPARPTLIVRGAWALAARKAEADRRRAAEQRREERRLENREGEQAQRAQKLTREAQALLALERRLEACRPAVAPASLAPASSRVADDVEDGGIVLPRSARARSREEFEAISLYVDQLADQIDGKREPSFGMLLEIRKRLQCRIDSRSGVSAAELEDFKDTIVRTVKKIPDARTAPLLSGLLIGHLEEMEEYRVEERSGDQTTLRRLADGSLVRVSADPDGGIRLELCHQVAGDAGRPTSGRRRLTGSEQDDYRRREFSWCQDFDRLRERLSDDGVELEFEIQAGDVDAAVPVVVLENAEDLQKWDAAEDDWGEEERTWPEPAEKERET